MAGRRERFLKALGDAKARRGVAVMGICNVTPDSFSDGGSNLSAAEARARVDTLLAEGADIIDIGGESTRPGAARISADVQIARILPAIEYAASRACVSVDTTLPSVARAALEAGACVVNDVSCMADGELARVAGVFDAAIVLMHSRPEHFAGGASATMFSDGDYGATAEAIVARVVDEWRLGVMRAKAAGFNVDAPGALVFDAGLGFSKSPRTSATLLARTQSLVAKAGVPVAVGASRKSLFSLVDAKAGPKERVGASVAAAMVAWRFGASIVRVHDVRATAQAIDVERLALVLGEGRDV